MKTVYAVVLMFVAQIANVALADTDSSALTPLKLTEPLSGPTVLLENMAIDASGVPRVVKLQSNQTIVLRNCTITGATSVIEGAAHDTTVTLENVRVGPTDRYALYLEARDDKHLPLYNKAYITATISKCTFDSSLNETPIRMMFGTRLEMTSTTVMDTVDLNSNKANQGLRLHCYSAFLAGNVIGKWTKIGSTGWISQEIVSGGNTYIGGVRIEPLVSLNMAGDTLDGLAGASGYAYSGSKPITCVMSNIKTTGKVGWLAEPAEAVAPVVPAPPVVVTPDATPTTTVAPTRPPRGGHGHGPHGGHRPR